MNPFNLPAFSGKPLLSVLSGLTGLGICCLSGCFPASSVVSAPPVLFQPELPFTIHRVAEAITPASSGQEIAPLCKNWHVAPDTLFLILRSAKPISRQEWHYWYDVLPCMVKMDLQQNGRSYPAEVNAGAWIHVVCPDTVLLFVADSTWSPSFMSTPFTE